MTDWGAVAAEAVFARKAVQKPAELARLLALCEQHRPRVIIEIGSDGGGTLWAWSQLPGPPRVISVDLPTGDFRGSSALADGHGAVMITGSSRSRAVFGEVTALLGGELADMLFIDADHSYEGVSSDFAAWRRLVRPGGLIAFHDIVPHTLLAVGVHQFWTEVTSTWPRNGVTEIRAYPETEPWGGIGILCSQPAFLPPPVRVPATVPAR